MHVYRVLEETWGHRALECGDFGAESWFIKRTLKKNYCFIKTCLHYLDNVEKSQF